MRAADYRDIVARVSADPGAGGVDPESFASGAVRVPETPEIKTGYYDVCRFEGFEAKKEAHVCMSCATCRDCHMCEATCYWGAIERKDLPGGAYEYVVDEERCIGCGFCAGACPCRIWQLMENEPLESVNGLR